MERIRGWLLENLGLKLLSLGLACLLWAVVLGEQKVEVSIDLPLELAIPADLALVNDPPETLEIQLRGPRTLVRTAVPREVALQRLAPKLVEGENVIPIRREMVQAPRGIEVVGVLPQRLRLILEPLTEREVEVSPRIQGAPPEGYAVQQVTVSPARVRLAGPAGALRRVARVHTFPVGLQGQTGPFTAKVLLEPPALPVRLQGEGMISVRVEIAPRRP